MACYKIVLMQTVIEKAEVFVEANTADQAEEIALKEASIGLAEFRFSDSFGDIEVIELEEIQTTGA